MSSPEVRWRRTHKKSKQGCLTCKLRKVKCDELHPICGNCRRLGSACSFVRAYSDAIRSQSIPPRLSQSPRREETDRASCILDLRLLHNFATAACYMFPETEDPRVLDLWAVHVPQLGFMHEFLLDAILCASAFHHYTMLNDPPMLAIAHRYFGRAVAKHREALAEINRSTADPLCLSSVLIMFLTFRIYSQKALKERATAPIEWFRIINGVHRLISVSRPYLGSVGMGLLLEKGMESLAEVDTRTSEEMQQLQKIKVHLLPKGLLESEALDDESKLSRQWFREKLDQLLTAALAGDTKPQLRRRLLGLAATREEAFRRLVEKEDPMTMILISHYFVFFKWTGGNWWLQYTLDVELNRLSQIIPKEYLWTVDLNETDICGTRSQMTEI